MTGKEILDKCPQDVKDIIIKHFGSLNDFYGYVYLLNINQHKKFKLSQQFDNTSIDCLKDFLEQCGIDFMLADEIIDEIGGDYMEKIAFDHISKLLGENWHDKLDAFDKMIGLIQS